MSCNIAMSLNTNHQRQLFAHLFFYSWHLAYCAVIDPMNSSVLFAWYENADLFISQECESCTTHHYHALIWHKIIAMEDGSNAHSFTSHSFASCITSFRGNHCRRQTGLTRSLCRNCCTDLSLLRLRSQQQPAFPCTDHQ